MRSTRKRRHQGKRQPLKLPPPPENFEKNENEKNSFLSMTLVSSDPVQDFIDYGVKIYSKYNQEEYFPPDVQREAKELYEKIPVELRSPHVEGIKALLSNAFRALNTQGTLENQLSRANSQIQELQNQLYARNGKKPKKTHGFRPDDIARFNKNLTNFGKYNLKSKGVDMGDISNYTFGESNQRIGDNSNMELLAKLILDLKKDIKKVREAQTIKGAEDYVAQRNKNIKDEKKHWKVDYRDINGDAIKDVLVVDDKGRFRLINGYGLTSQNPLKKKYLEYLQDEFGNPRERKLAKLAGANIQSYRDWKNQGMNIQYDPNDIFGAPTWSNNTELGRHAQNIIDYNDQYYKEHGIKHIYRDPTPRRKTAMAAFSKLIAKEVYDKFMQDQPEDRKKIVPFIAFSGKAYKAFVTQTLEKEINDPEQVRYMKKIRHPEGGTYWSRLCKNYVLHLLDNEKEKTQNDCAAFLQQLLNTELQNYAGIQAKYMNQIQ